ncbi:hypothetical protein INT48_003343 [Thamnidium elegans]|uniref:CST complex subunit CTC1 n=1 Tax=Thamnidium elegans TaxID=101142 RepID=A0A8H7SI75_9FUNG|nr:hypothetical protein INT48_003343 [Thamnidium elegans]
MSAVITPKHLFESTHGQTSNGQKLSGMLFMVTKGTSLERGTTELVDLTTKQFIPCLVDGFIPKYHKVKVLITEWNYIFDSVNGYRYLEFQLDSVFTERSEESILRRHILSQNILYQSLQHVFYVPNHKLSCATAKRIDLAGQIYAISSLFALPDIRSHFYLQLVRDQQCVTIQFSGKDCEKFHRYFRIGSLHCFRNLSIISVSGSDMLSFDSNASNCVITPIQYQEITIKPNHPTYPLTVTEVYEDPVKFTGSITRVIDALFGIYELENKLILCLFHYMNYSPDRPFRLGTRLCIFQFHATKLSTSLHTSHLLNLWQVQNDCPMLIACQNTSIEIKSFAPHYTVPTEPIQSIKLKHMVYMDIVMHQTNFIQLMQQLEIYATLQYKFSNTTDLDEEALLKAFESIRKHALGIMEPCQIDSEGFLRHNEVCQVVTCGKNVMLNSYPDLKNVKSNLEDKLVPYSLDLAGENHMYEQNKVFIQRALFDNEFVLLGRVDMVHDGRIVLVDNSSRILLITTKNIEVGAIYICIRARLFREDLSTVNMETREVVRPDCTYLSCDGSDLYAVYRPQQTTFQIQQDISSIVVDRFVCDRLVETYQQRFYVVHVITTFPIEVMRQHENVMENRVIAVLYSLQGPQSKPISIDAGKRIILVTNNRNQSLKFNRQLQLDRWCVILGLIQPGSNENKTTFFLSEKLHEIYPIIMTTKQTANTIQLRAIASDLPQSTATTATNIIEPVYNISQLTTEALYSDPKDMEKGKHFYIKPANITGIIVSKHFSKGFAEDLVSDKEAEEAYHAFGIGTAKSNRNIQVQLRQLDGLETIVIYIDSPTQHYPLGLVTGAHVTFRNLLRKHGRHSAYRFHCITNSESTFEVETTIAPENDVINKEDIPVIVFSQLHSELVDGIEREDTIFKVCCYIRSVILLRLKWYCITCKSIVRNGNCYYMCESGQQIFLASAYIELSDSKACGNANVDGERLVFQILNLNERQCEALKQVVYQYGEIYYEGWRTPEQTKYNKEEEEEEKEYKAKEKIGYQLRDICNKAKSRGNVWIYAKRQFEKKQELLQRLRKVKMSDKNCTLTTWEFEKIKLKVIETEEIDAITLSYEYLLKSLHDFMNQ